VWVRSSWCARTDRIFDVESMHVLAASVVATWLKEQGLEFTVEVEHAALDPFRGYANAIRDELPDAIAVLDAFHVVRLGSQALDEVRRRVQQQTLHRRGHRDDPLYRIRGNRRAPKADTVDKKVVAAIGSVAEVTIPI